MSKDFGKSVSKEDNSDKSSAKFKIAVAVGRLQ
jgi:hypothetical protein